MPTPAPGCPTQRFLRASPTALLHFPMSAQTGAPEKPPFSVRTPAGFTHKILHGPANGWPSFHAHLTALSKICHTIKPLEFERPIQAFHITKSYHPPP